MNASRSACLLSVRRVIVEAESPEELPKNSSKAGTKSPLERPCRYKSGRTSETFGDLLM
jgi:hypothetical protein